MRQILPQAQLSLVFLRKERGGEGGNEELYNQCIEPNRLFENYENINRFPNGSIVILINIERRQQKKKFQTYFFLFFLKENNT